MPTFSSNYITKQYRNEEENMEIDTRWKLKTAAKSHGMVHLEHFHFCGFVLNDSMPPQDVLYPKSSFMLTALLPDGLPSVFQPDGYLCFGYVPVTSHSLPKCFMVDGQIGTECKQFKPLIILSIYEKHQHEDPYAYVCLKSKEVALKQFFSQVVYQ